MEPRIIPKKNPEEATSADLLEAVFQNLNLSDENRAKARFYHRLSQLPKISKSGLALTERFWDQAQDDEQLEAVLSFIDGLVPPCLADQPLLSENTDMRAYLSEHIHFLAAGKLKQKQGGVEPRVARSTVTYFCPDGSGVFRPNPNDEGVVDLDSQGVCPQCEHKLSEHRQRIETNAQSQIGESVSRRCP